MITTEFFEFRAIFANLCLAVGAEDDKARRDLFFTQLEDVPLQIVRAGAEILCKSHRKMPTVAHWRDACDRVVLDQARALLPHEVLERRIVCEACQDTGWVEPSHGMTCPGDGSCGMQACRRLHRMHTYTAKCSCRASNAVFQHHHPITKTYGAEAAGTGRPRPRRHA